MATKSVTKYPTWEYAFLSAIGAPQNEAQLEALNLWARAEGMPDGANNWLAFTAPTSNLNEWGTVGTSSAVEGRTVAPGQWNIFDNGQLSVVTYPTLASGVKALVDFLQHGHQDIIDALRDPNATVVSIGDAITADRAWGADGKKIIAYSQGKDVAIYNNGGTTGGGATQKTGGFTQCDSSHAVIGSGGIFGVGAFTLVNECQAKALMGGLTIGLGLVTMNVGMAILLIGFTVNSTLGKAALDLIPGTGSTISRVAKLGGQAIDKRTKKTTAVAPAP